MLNLFLIDKAEDVQIIYFKNSFFYFTGKYNVFSALVFIYS